MAVWQKFLRTFFQSKRKVMITLPDLWKVSKDFLSTITKLFFNYFEKSLPDLSSVLHRRKRLLIKFSSACFISSLLYATFREALPLLQPLSPDIAPFILDARSTSRRRDAHRNNAQTFRRACVPKRVALRAFSPAHCVCVQCVGGGGRDRGRSNKGVGVWPRKTRAREDRGPGPKSACARALGVNAPKYSTITDSGLWRHGEESRERGGGLNFRVLRTFNG